MVWAVYPVLEWVICNLLSENTFIKDTFAFYQDNDLKHISHVALVNTRLLETIADFSPVSRLKRYRTRLGRIVKKAL